MAMVLDDPEHPFFAIVGNSQKPTWPEAAVAFASFYHLVANGHYVHDAVAAMRVASGNDRFFVTTAEESKQGYIDFIKENPVDTVQAIQDLKDDERADPPEELAKKLRASDGNNR
jgi:hypothetical protein